MRTAAVLVQKVEHGRRARATVDLKEHVVSTGVKAPSFLKKSSSKTKKSTKRLVIQPPAEEKEAGMTVSLSPNVHVQLKVLESTRGVRSDGSSTGLTSFEVTGPAMLYDFLTGFIFAPGGVSYRDYRLRGVCAPFALITLNEEARYVARPMCRVTRASCSL